MTEREPSDSSRSPLNPRLGQGRSYRAMPTAEELIEGILAGDRVRLGRAITLVESRAGQHRETAHAIVEGCLPHSGRSMRIGITGSPGVGKSTFIEALGLRIIEGGGRVAVLAVDPSSQRSQGSILGDKTRMEQLSRRPEAFIRPSPAGGSLGGVARKTRETILLCEAAGFDYIIVETVGVGQSEIAVHSMVDFFLLLLMPGAGDELQGIKRGIIEMADLIAINKADGDRLAAAREALRTFRNALHLFPAKESGWTPEVLTCSALEGAGVDEIRQNIESFRTFILENGYFKQHRNQQARYWLYESIDAQLRDLFYSHPQVAGRRAILETAVREGRISPFQAAEELIRIFRE